MNNLKLLLTWSLRWLGIEALTYQGLLLGHQLLLFKVADSYNYGVIGTVFAVVYFCVALADLGLEPSISPFFSEVIKGKYIFRRFFTFNLLLSFFGVLFLIGWILLLGFFCKLKIFLSLAVPMIATLGILIISETVKKTVRTVLHLALYNKFVALVEIFTIVFYIASVWGLYFLYSFINLFVVFVPMAITSVASCLVMLCFLRLYVKKLPDCSDTMPSLKRIVSSRFFNYINHMSHTFFSSNFLIPFFAMQFGFAYAGLFKLASHIAYGATNILRKVFGFASDALFARAKTMHLASTQELFSQLMMYLNHALYGIILFLAINHQKLFAVAGNNNVKISLYLFLLICLSENFFIAYEKLFITRERVGVLFLLNIISIFSTYCLVAAQYIPFPIVLFVIILIRFSFFLLLAMTSFYLWKIKPQLQLKPHFLLLIVCMSVCFYFIK